MSNTSDWVNTGNRYKRLIPVLYEKLTKINKDKSFNRKMSHTGKKQFKNIKKRSKINIWKDANYY